MYELNCELSTVNFLFFTQKVKIEEENISPRPTYFFALPWTTEMFKFGKGHFNIFAYFTLLSPIFFHRFLFFPLFSFSLLKFGRGWGVGGNCPIKSDTDCLYSISFFWDICKNLIILICTYHNMKEVFIVFFKFDMD